MNSFIRTCAVIATVLAGATTAASAQSSPAPAPSPSPSPPPKTLQLSAFADAGYTSRLGETTTRWANNSPSRVFDYNDRSADVQNLNVQAVLTAGNLGGKVELSSGTDADIIASYPGAFNGFDLTYAYLTYAAGKFTLQGGKYGTLAGAEVIESPSNTQFSRSILFGYAVPFTHTGGRITYAYDSHLSLIAGVNAGWDVLRSTNGRLTGEGGIAYNPSSALGFTVQGYSGIAQLSNYANPYNPYVQATGNGVPSGAQGSRSLIDAVGTWHPSSAWTVVVNYDSGRQANAASFTVDGASTAIWSGLAGYGTYQINPRLSASVRLEGFHDSDGYRTGFAQFWREGTGTLAWAATPSVTVRGEFRHDISDHPVFLRTDLATFDTRTQTIGIEMLVKY